MLWHAEDEESQAPGRGPKLNALRIAESALSSQDASQRYYSFVRDSESQSGSDVNALAVGKDAHQLHHHLVHDSDSHTGSDTNTAAMGKDAQQLYHHVCYDSESYTGSDTNAVAMASVGSSASKAMGRRPGKYPPREKLGAPFHFVNWNVSWSESSSSQTPDPGSKSGDPRKGTARCSTDGVAPGDFRRSPDGASTAPLPMRPHEELVAEAAAEDGTLRKRVRPNKTKRKQYKSVAARLQGLTPEALNESIRTFPPKSPYLRAVLRSRGIVCDASREAQQAGSVELPPYFEGGAASSRHCGVTPSAASAAVSEHRSTRISL